MKNFLNSLAQVLEVFYVHGGKKTRLVFLFQSLYLLLELLCLLWLYLVMDCLFQVKNQLTIPLFGHTISLSIAVVTLFVLYLFKFFYSIYLSRFLIGYCYKVNFNLTHQIIHFYYSLNEKEAEEIPRADALNKLFTVGGFFSEIIFQSFLLILNESLLTLIILVSLLVFNFKLLILLILIFSPICVILLYYSRKKLSKTSKNLMNENVEYHQSVMTLLHGMKDIKFSGHFEFFYQDFEKKIKKLHRSKKTISLENTFPSKILELVSIGSIALLFFFYTSLSNEAAIQTIIAAFATAAFRLIPSFNRIISSIQNFKLYKSYTDFVSTMPRQELKINNQPYHEPEKIQSIVLKDVTFRRISKKILKNISMEFVSGKMYGLTGESGAGKTSFANLIMGSLKPDDGIILFNHKEVTDEMRPDVLHAFAHVTQDPYFPNVSIAENIAFGFKDPDLERIHKCLDRVHLAQWTKARPQGLQTVIGDDASKLSGGEKQRLALARAIYRKASVIILDEPTSALDAQTKSQILELIREITYAQNLITIVITHDQEVLHICDTKLILKNETLSPIK